MDAEGPARLPQRYCVLRDYTMVYPDALAVTAGESVLVGKEDTQWPYVWCTNSAGKGGWIPQTYIQRDGARGRVLRDFDSCELTVSVGEIVLATMEEGGWLWCRNDQGQSGWVPEENLQAL